MTKLNQPEPIERGWGVTDETLEGTKQMEKVDNRPYKPRPWYDSTLLLPFFMIISMVVGAWLMWLFSEIVPPADLINGHECHQISSKQGNYIAYHLTLNEGYVAYVCPAIKKDAKGDQPKKVAKP